MTPTELSPLVISGLYNKFASFDSPLSRYFPAQPNLAQGPNIWYDIYSYSKGMAPLVPRFAGAPKGKAPTLGKVAFDGVTIKQALEPEISAMLDGRAPGTLSGSARDQMVASAVRQIRLAADRRLEWLRAQWLTAGAMLSSAGVPTVVPSGTVYFDYEDALKKSTPLSVSIGMTSTHRLTYVGASWATAATNIKGDLDTWRDLIMVDSGVDARHVIMNHVTHDYLVNNTLAQKSLLKNDQLAQKGYISELWGYTFEIRDERWYSPASEAGTEGSTNYYVPSGVAILCSEDNVASGRQLVECSASDAEAPASLRGVYAWADRDTVHPHNTTYGLEWTGSPAILVPDSFLVCGSVTATS